MEQSPKDIRLPFFSSQNGRNDMVFDPKTGREVRKITYLTPEEVRQLKSGGYTLEQVEPDHFNTFIENSQTTHDRN